MTALSALLVLLLLAGAAALLWARRRPVGDTITGGRPSVAVSSLDGELEPEAGG